MSEFLQAYFKSEFVALAVILLVSCIIGLVFSIRHFPLLASFNIKTSKRLTYLGLLVSLCIILLFRFSFLPYITLRASYTYHKERQALYKTKIEKYGNFKTAIHNSLTEEEIAVILIGESTSRSHMSLYGYERKTNPLLLKKKNELVIYNQVNSPHSHTIESLGKALTLGNYENPSKKFNSTIIQLFNSVDYETYWISNQKPFGMYETSTRLISKMSDHSVFTKMTDVMLDEHVISPFQKALNEKANRKFIVIHLMGTHSVYANRYSPQFNVFKSIPTTKFKHEEAYSTINEYDNAILYNDYIVNTIIDLVKKQNKPSYVLYFSDHGEDVYETIDQACHTEDIGTKPMFEVPFLLWFSKKYTNSRNHLDLDPSRAYNIRELIHTIADLSNITFDDYKPELSIVNSKFDKRYFKNQDEIK